MSDDNEYESDLDNVKVDIKSILVITTSNNLIGGSFFNLDTQCLELLCDVELSLAIDDNEQEALFIIENLLYQLKPDVVVISSRVSDKIEAFLNQFKRSNDIDHDKGGLNFEIEIRPSNEFSITKSRQYFDKLINSKINGFGLLEGLFNEINAPLVLCSFSCLMKYSELKGNFTIVEIKLFILEDSLFIDNESLISLQIYSSSLTPTNHPNYHSKSKTPSSRNITSTSKKNQLQNLQNFKLTLFDILNFTVSNLGFQLFENWFKRPLSNIKLINQRLDCINFLINPNYTGNLEILIDEVKGIGNIWNILKNIKVGKINFNGWRQLVEFNEKCIKIRRILINNMNDDDNDELQLPEILAEICDSINEEAMHYAYTLITTTVDFTLSKELNRTTINYGHDTYLDDLRTTYNEMDSILSYASKEISRGLPDLICDLINVVYFPQVGYLLVLPLEVDINNVDENGNRFGDLVEDIRDWNEVFRTTSHIYYKSGEMVRMDEYYGDIYGLICDREIEIIYEMQTKIVEISNKFHSACSGVAQLDCLLSLSRAALIHNYNRPVISPDPILRIRQGRHPLYETLVPSFIPNDTIISAISTPDIPNDNDQESESEIPSMNNKDGNDTSLILLTGANFSGKSVYLAQNALITFMAHIGSYVPALSAEIGITDKILTRIATRESVMKNISSFVIDINQVNKIISLATKQSLVIIDEFGKGTDIIDGPALFAAVIKHFDYKNETGAKFCPRLIAATHHHELIENDILKEENGLKYKHMEIMISDDNPGAQDSDLPKSDSITYLYKLKNGKSNGSFGTFCAAFCGISPKIVKRAQELYNLISKNEDLVSIYDDLTTEEEQAISNAKNISLKFLDLDFEQLSINHETNSDGDGKVREILESILNLKE